MDPIRLRKIAAWLDLSDELLYDYFSTLRADQQIDAGAFADLVQMVRGTEFQDQLREWADKLEKEST